MKGIQEESFGIIPLSHQEGKWKVCILRHTSGGHWGFPKGKKEPGESSLQAATRELKEETGLAITSLLDPNPLVEHYTFTRENHPVEKKVVYFLALVSGELLLQPEEIEQGEWLTLQEAQEKLTYPQTKALCSSMKKRLEKSQ